MTTVLFVCTGNTCRSPMAACLFNALCDRAGAREFRAVSAGLSALSGMPASDGARRAMKARGLSLEAHRSRPVTDALLSQAACVVCVSERHAETVRARFPRWTLPVRAFDPPIADPYGGDEECYELTARALEPQIAAMFHLMRAEG